MYSLREVTIGRAKDSDIYLDQRCAYASSRHGTIYYDGSQMMFRDTSTNGTMINNVMVHKRAVPVNHGDQIVVAGKYPISWNQIDSFFPAGQAAQPVQQQAPLSPARQAALNAGVVDEAGLNLNGWSWGAFAMYGLWGLFNGCWWAILISLIGGYFYPIPNIIFGIKGRRMAWEKGSWNSAQDFIQTQHNWDIAGMIVFGITILSIVIWIIALAA